VLEESKAGHALTQQMLGNMMKAELRAGLRSLSDGLALLQKDPQDGMARGQLGEAKSSLVKHLEFLREEEAAGRATAVEHWAVVRLALASSYLGIGLERQAVAELEELMALPVQGEGLARLRERLPAELQTAKVRYFDERTPALDVRAQGLQFTERRLGEWLEVLKGERGRLGELKRRAGELVAGSEVLRGAWAERAGRAGARAREAEDALALRALMVLGAEFSKKRIEHDIQWVTIPAGSFQMGSQDGESDEKPIHTVTLKAFQMSKTEVTVKQYRSCVAAGVCSEPESCGIFGSPNWSSSPGSKENHPINCVDWGQARTFAKWVGADLPTEAEWEYAARGGQSFTYASSNSLDDVAWYSSNSGGDTKPVGTKQANAFGLHDMSGNVWEWTLDEYKSDYNGAPSDGHQAVGSIPTCSTKCDNGAARRVFRGGCWFYDASHLRVALRYCISPVPRNGNLGLRLRRTLP